MSITDSYLGPNKFQGSVGSARAHSATGLLVGPLCKFDTRYIISATTSRMLNETVQTTLAPTPTVTAWCNEWRTNRTP